MFLLVGMVAVAGGLGTVLSKNVVYAALSLLVSLLAVAGIFVLVSSPFLALVQVLVYGGAIIVVVLFALMLTRTSDATVENLDNAQKPFAMLVGAGTAIALGITVVRNGWPAVPAGTDLAANAGQQMSDVGRVLFTQWSVPFEVASLLLLVALIGAIIIARAEAE
jgi:NADH-quinone oxidoreductase subunit J